MVATSKAKKDTDSRLDAIEERVSVQDAYIKQSMANQNKILKTQEYLVELLKNVNVDEFGKTTNAINDRLSVLNERLANLLHRDCVATETCFYIRQTYDSELMNRFYKCLMYAYDAGEDFFNFKGSAQLTVKEWADKILNIKIDDYSKNLEIQSGIHTITSLSM